jgi:imidazolonepropionase-like amidohydrolase
MHLLSAWLVATSLAAGSVPPVPQTSPPVPSRADDGEALFLKAEKVIVRPGKVIENGRVLVRDGLVVAVGSDLEAPEGVPVIEGKVICAGFLDPWSSLGVEPAALKDSRTNPDTRTTAAIDSYGSDLAREEARQAGVLGVRVQAGSRAKFGGFGAWLSTGPGDDMASLVILEDANLGAVVGLGSRGTTDPFDRISMVDKLVDELRSGLDYRFAQTKYRKDMAAWQEAIVESEAKLAKDFKKAKKKRDKEVAEAEEKGKDFKESKYKEDKRPKPPKFDAEDAALARVAGGEVPLVVEAHRAAELRELLAGTAQFDRLRLVIAGGTEALTVADELAKRRIPVIVYPAPLGSGQPDHLSGHDLSLAAQLEEKDVPVLLGSGGGNAARDLPLLAALAIGHGLDPEEAFAALTLRAARVFDVADQMGSVQRGRRADLLVLDGEPFALATSVTHVLVRGQVVVSPKEGQ